MVSDNTCVNNIDVTDKCIIKKYSTIQEIVIYSMHITN